MAHSTNEPQIFDCELLYDWNSRRKFGTAFTYSMNPVLGTDLYTLWIS